MMEMTRETVLQIQCLDIFIKDETKALNVKIDDSLVKETKAVKAKFEADLADLKKSQEFAMENNTRMIEAHVIELIKALQNVIMTQGATGRGYSRGASPDQPIDPLIEAEKKKNVARRQKQSQAAKVSNGGTINREFSRTHTDGTELIHIDTDEEQSEEE